MFDDNRDHLSERLDRPNSKTQRMIGPINDESIIPGFYGDLFVKPQVRAWQDCRPDILYIRETKKHWVTLPKIVIGGEAQGA